MNAPHTRAATPSEQREDLIDDFREWQRDGIRGLRECQNNPREDADFDEWLEMRSQPHMRDWQRYAAATGETRLADLYASMARGMAQ